jgi:hypothetical protein
MAVFVDIILAAGALITLVQLAAKYQLGAAS